MESKSQDFDRMTDWKAELQPPETRCFRYIPRDANRISSLHNATPPIPMTSIRTTKTLRLLTTTSRQRWLQVLTTTTRTTAGVLLILVLLRHGDGLILASRRARAKALHVAHVISRTIHTTIRVFKYTFEFLESVSRWQTQVDTQGTESSFTTPETRRVRRSIPPGDSSESEDCDRRQYRHSAQLVSTSTVPRSLDRLLALAASPRGASGVVAAGATAGAVAAARGPPALAMVDTCVKALSTPHGTHVLSVAVTSAIDALLGREPQSSHKFQKNSSFFMHNGVTSRPRSYADRSCRNTGDFNDLIANPNVRSLLVDIAERVTRTAVTHVFPSTQCRDSPGSQVCSVPPSTKNGPANRDDKLADDSSPSNSSTSSYAPSPYAQWDRLVLAVLRDRPFVRDMVRVAVAQAVRSYVLTHAELRTRGSGNDSDANGVSPLSDRSNEDTDGKKDTPADSVCSEAKNGERTGERGRQGSLTIHSASTDGQDTDKGSEKKRAANPRKSLSQPASMWNALTRLAAVDIRRLLYQQHTSPTSTGWTVF